MKEKLKRLLENGQFNEVENFIKINKLSTPDAQECMIETLKAYRKLLVDSIQKLEIGTNTALQC